MASFLGEPWRALASPGAHWRTLASPGGPWRALASPGEPWRALWQALRRAFGEPLASPGEPWRVMCVGRKKLRGRLRLKLVRSSTTPKFLVIYYCRSFGGILDIRCILCLLRTLAATCAKTMYAQGFVIVLGWSDCIFAGLSRNHQKSTHSAYFCLVVQIRAIRWILCHFEPRRLPKSRMC